MQNVMATPSSSASTDAYAPGLDHYASRHRRDAVKRLWEEPVTFSILRAALAQVPTSRSLSVMDIGCGAGEGLHLHTAEPLEDGERVTLVLVMRSPKEPWKDGNSLARLLLDDPLDSVRDEWIQDQQYQAGLYRATAAADDT
ncbi:hypothetical protein AB0I84_28650 [Streptomyces spectabilis]|uniref:hypothetical protein n=1 Tax=Streptomyces spectabilis TaxID=68270 RepID=UPI0034040DA9